MDRHVVTDIRVGFGLLEGVDRATGEEVISPPLVSLKMEYAFGRDDATLMMPIYMAEGLVRDLGHILAVVGPDGHRAERPWWKRFEREHLVWVMLGAVLALLAGLDGALTAMTTHESHPNIFGALRAFNSSFQYFGSAMVGMLIARGLRNRRPRRRIRAVIRDAMTPTPLDGSHEAIP